LKHPDLFGVSVAVGEVCCSFCQAAQEFGVRETSFRESIIK